MSIRSVPSLKSLNESETNFSVANIPFDILSKGISLNGSIKHSSIIDKIDVTSSWSFLILDYCKSVWTYFFVFAPKNSCKCEYKLARYEALIVHRSTALVLVLKPVSPPGILVSLWTVVSITLSGSHLPNGFVSDSWTEKFPFLIVDKLLDDWFQGWAFQKAKVSSILRNCNCHMHILIANPNRRCV